MKHILVLLFIVTMNSCSTNKYFTKKKINSFVTFYNLKKPLNDGCKKIIFVRGIPHFSFYKIYTKNVSTNYIEWYYEDHKKYILSRDTTQALECKKSHQLIFLSKILEEKIDTNMYWVKTKDTVSPIYNLSIKKYILKNISK